MQPRKPIFLFIVAGFGIAIGALGLICKPLSVASLLLGPDPGPVPVPFFNQTVQIPDSVKYLEAVTAGIGWLYAIVLLAGCVGTYLRKPWARTAMNSYAIISIMTKVAWAILYGIAMMPMMQQIMAAQNPPPPPGLMGVSMVIGMLCIMPFLIAYQVVVLVTYNLRSTRDFLAGIDSAPAPTAAPPGAWPGYAPQPAALPPYYPDPNAPAPYPPQYPPAGSPPPYGYPPPQYGYPPPQYGYPPAQAPQQPPAADPYGPPPPPAYPTSPNSPPPPPPPPPPDRQA